MKTIPLLDFEANLNPVNFEEEAKILNLNYCFKHIFDIEELNKYQDIIITDKAALNNIQNFINKNIYLWIIEPPVVNSCIYEFAKKNNKKFKKIFSHNKKFCSEIENAFWYPWGSYFIPLNEHFLYEKNKNTSIVCSSKSWTEGHKFRHQCFEKIKHLLDGYKYGDPVEPKIKWHKEYRFSIAVENCVEKGYFTEKILDCFRTGTIPIYKGDPEILNYFNKDGILLFNELEELEEIVKKADEKFYQERINAVNENFIKAQPYLFPWKYIKENYLNEIL
jgi:hypothetical protein